MMQALLEYTESGLYGMGESRAQICRLSSSDYFEIIVLFTTGETKLPSVISSEEEYTSTFLFWNSCKVFLLYEGRDFDCMLKMQDHIPVIETINQKLKLDIRQKTFNFGSIEREDI